MAKDESCGSKLKVLMILKLSLGKTIIKVDLFYTFFESLKSYDSENNLLFQILFHSICDLVFFKSLRHLL